MDASMSFHPVTEAEIFQATTTIGVQLTTGQMIPTKQLLQSLQHHLQGCLHMNEPCCFMTGRAQRHNHLPLSQQPCSNHWRSTQVHDGSIPLARNTWSNGIIWLQLAELPIYTKENRSKQLKRVHLQAYDQSMWWCDIMCLYIRFDIHFWASTYSRQSSTKTQIP